METVREFAKSFYSTVPCKFRLQRVRLNRGGYDRSGHYYGTGQPLYCAWSEQIDDGYAFDIRADDRADAKRSIIAMYALAKFY